MHMKCLANPHSLNFFADLSNTSDKRPCPKLKVAKKLRICQQMIDYVKKVHSDYVTNDYVTSKGLSVTREVQQDSFYLDLSCFAVSSRIYLTHFCC